MTSLKTAAIAAGLALLSGCAGQRPSDLGVQRDGKLKKCPDSPNCVLSQADDDRHRIAPLTFTGDADRAWDRLKLVVGRRGDANVVEERKDYLRVEFRTRLGFVDDAEFLLDRSRRLIQLRSASRIGYSDFGKNRSRMEEVRGNFKAALEGR